MTLNFDETTIIEACRQGDRKAQGLLFDRFSRKMFAVTRRYAATSFEAEDLLMNAFMVIFTRLADYKSQGSFEGWMRRIVVNECLQHLRRNRMLFVAADEENTYTATDNILPSHNLEEAELLELVRQLPEGYRAVFNLYAIDGFNHREIGELLGISENTSKSQLSRARNLLQTHLLHAEESLKRVRV
ncbi:MAG: sigma-70 family RNA polymerase sigma factor [Bacteroidota bacterium]